MTSDDKTLTPREIGTVFAILTFLGVLCLLSGHLFGSNAATPFFWVWLSAAVILAPWPIARMVPATTQPAERFGRILNSVARFGDKLWGFPNLWFVVFIVGAYVALIGMWQRCIGEHVSPLEFSELLIATRDLILAAFLAVVTSVMTHTFGQISESSYKIDESVRQITDLKRDISSLSEYELPNLLLTLKSVSSISDISGRVTSLTSKAYKITAEMHERFGAFSITFNNLSHSMGAFANTCLVPLLPPGVPPPTKERDTFLELVSTMESNSGVAQHAAFMAAAVSRYLQAEADERQTPGVMLNFTSFAYYARTVQETVQSLSPWPGKFEFYTLMTKSPAEMLQFSNTINFSEWMRFLEIYNSYVTTVASAKPAGNRYIRYFAYGPEPNSQWSKKYKYLCYTKLQKQLKYGLVKCVDGSDWKPQDFSEEEWENFLCSNFSVYNQGQAREENTIRGDRATLVVVNGTPSQVSTFTLLRDAIRAFHVVDENCCYRVIDDSLVKDIFKNKLIVEQRAFDEEHNCFCPGRQYSIPFPRDIFAVREVKDDIEHPEKQWIFVIGLCESEDKDTGLGLSIVFDLSSMDESAGINADAAQKVREYLQRIFFPNQGAAEGHVLTHDQFLQRHCEIQSASKSKV